MLTLMIVIGIFIFKVCKSKSISNEEKNKAQSDNGMA